MDDAEASWLNTRRNVSSCVTPFAAVLMLRSLISVEIRIVYGSLPSSASLSTLLDVTFQFSVYSLGELLEDATFR